MQVIHLLIQHPIGKLLACWIRVSASSDATKLYEIENEPQLKVRPTLKLAALHYVIKLRTNVLRRNFRRTKHVKLA